MKTKKPKVLFTIPTLAGGGAEKSLVTLLQVLGEHHGGGRDFDVDLLLFDSNGLFLPQVPSWVRVLFQGKRWMAFRGPWLKACLYLLLHGRPDLLPARFRFRKYWRIPAEERPALFWKSLRRVMPRLRTEYDVVVAYLEGIATYHCVEKVSASHKIAFFHSDYRNHAARDPLDAQAYPFFDIIVGVSESCCEALREAFPALADRVRCVENIVSPGLLKQLAVAQEAPWESSPSPTLLTIARLSEAKGIDIAIQACGILKRAGVALRWFVIGKGELEAPLRAMIAQEGVEDRFFLLGERANPYPALAACDIYVQPSRYEGKCIAIEEAKGLAKPIVTTRYATVRTQIDEGKTGLLAEIDAQSLAQAIHRLLEDGALRAMFSENLQNTLGNVEEARKFMELMDLFPAN